MTCAAMMTSEPKSIMPPSIFIGWWYYKHEKADGDAYKENYGKNGDDGLCPLVQLFAEFMLRHDKCHQLDIKREE